MIKLYNILKLAQEKETSSKLDEVLRALQASEMISVMFYEFAASVVGTPATEAIEEFFKEHAKEELEHFSKLASRLHELGSYSISSPSSIQKYEGSVKDLKVVNSCKSHDVKELGRVSLQLEKNAIEAYNRAIQIAISKDDQATIHLLREIISDEEEHRADFQALYEG